MNTLLKFFFSLILASNNLLLKIYYENIIAEFLNFNFLFFILFFSLSLFLSFTCLFIFFFHLFFSSTHVFFTSPYLHFWLFFILFFFTRIHQKIKLLEFVHSHSRTYHFFFLFLYFPPHIQPHSPHPCTSSSWSSQVISLNFTRNLQYLSQPTSTQSDQWRNSFWQYPS